MCSAAEAIVGGSLFGLRLFFTTILLYARNLMKQKEFVSSHHIICTASRKKQRPASIIFSFDSLTESRVVHETTFRSNN